MKVKYLSGKKVNEIVDLDEVKAKSLIEDGLAEEVTAEDTELETAMKGLDAKIEAVATKAAEVATKKAMDTVAKGIGNVSNRIVVGVDRDTLDPQGGFKSSSHFYNEVKNSAVNGSPTKAMQNWLDVSLKSTGGNETTSADGGYAVPVQYASNIFDPFGIGPDFRSLIWENQMQSSVINIPVLKNYDRSNSTATAGEVATINSEGSSITPSKAQWEQVQLTLKKIACVVPVTNELLEDNNVSLGSVVSTQAGYQIKKACNIGILAGNSAYTGIIGHASCKISKRTTVNTVVFSDVLGMYANFAHDDADYNSSVWFAHPTVISQLGTMTTGNANIYFPPGGAQDGSVGRLLGRPIIVTGIAKTLGTAGDLVLADMKKYVGGVKGGVNTMSSPHVYFLTDEQAFRYTLRVTGRPGLSGKITLEDGSTTVSPFVELGTDTSGLS